MRLIDVEELKHRVINSKYYGTKRQRDFCDMIAESETIDAVEVVRCEDCKYNLGETRSGRTVLCNYCSHGALIERDKNWFCADGERRE